MSDDEKKTLLQEFIELLKKDFDPFSKFSNDETVGEHSVLFSTFLTYLQSNVYVRKLFELNDVYTLTDHGITAFADMKKREKILNDFIKHYL